MAKSITVSAVLLGVVFALLMVAPLGVFADEYDGYEPYFSFDGYEPYSSYDGYEPYSSYDGYEPYSSYDGYEPYSSYDGYEPYSSYDGYEPYSSYSGYEPYSSYSGYEPYSSYDGYSPSGGYMDIIEEGYIEESGVKYSMREYEQSYSTPGCSYCSGSSKSTPPFSVSPPNYSSPRPPSYPPSYPPQQPPRPQPQPPVYTSAASHTNVNTNTCTGNSCNTNVNNIDNSINGSFNTAPLTPVYTLPPQQLVQYVAPPQAGAYCVITASPTHIQNGQVAVLNWNSFGPGNAWISDGIGQVAPTGSLAVRPNVSTNYVLTVNGPGGPRTCNVFVNVAGSYVSLTQIPYTGLDLGTFGNAAYWAGLLSFAGAAAYLVLYYQGGAGSLATSFAGSIKLPQLPKLSLPKIQRAKRNEEETGETLAAPVMFTKKYVAKEIAPRSAKQEIDNLPVMRTLSAPKDAMTFDSGKIVVSRN